MIELGLTTYEAWAALPKPARTRLLAHRLLAKNTETYQALAHKLKANVTLERFVTASDDLRALWIKHAERLDGRHR